MQTEILDMLAYWDVRLQLCTTGESSVILHSEIPALNVAFGCFGIPPSAVQRNGDGYPQITSFTATRCDATILDVVNNRILGNDNFEVTFETGSGLGPVSRYLVVATERRTGRTVERVLAAHPAIDGDLDVLDQLRGTRGRRRRPWCAWSR